MFKYLILFVCSINLSAMETSLDENSPKKTFISDDDFKNFLNLCEKMPLNEEQCIRFEKFFEGKKRKREKEKIRNSKYSKSKGSKEIPQGVLVYSGGILIQKIEKTLPRTGVLYVSPSKPKRAIYCHFIVDDYWDKYVEIKDRIDVAQVLKELGIRVRDLNTKKNLHALLLAVELKLREIFLQNEDILRSIIYAGLAEDFRHRGYAHGGDIVHANEKKLASKKVKYQKGVLEDKHNIRMSYLIQNIPLKQLEVFECLMAVLTFVYDFGANAKIGNDAAWKKMNTYTTSKIRIDGIEKEFNYEIENLRKKIRQEILGVQNCEAAKLELEELSDDDDVSTVESGTASEEEPLI